MADKINEPRTNKQIRDKMELEKIIIETLNEFEFGNTLKNGDYITGVKTIYFGAVASQVATKLKAKTTVECTPENNCNSRHCKCTN